ncbi:hypothetical protein [Cellulomonas denverensis]|uniref:Uncharacterized protein n=1 Tax=Cellulomonas denverensis TaxID=264297 RepID=A0A7X6QZH3_9CELL|nr:hypothetical protein [Cellulomonas denverensis]NKY23081.1 hypothetical protein [Cellulomonas denverensis]GIG23838.1 hypothetical protein Cde04nite_00820 [Cellulomonas denverensis]
MDDYLWVLKRREMDLIREVEPDRMAELDEDELLNLHRRIRKARNKKISIYRRTAADQIDEIGARGESAPLNEKHRIRLAAFEEALSVVSARLAEVAHQAAEDLRDERIAQARAGRSPGPHVGAEPSDEVDTGRVREHVKTTGGVKRDADSLAQGARRQAKRDGR